MQGEPKLWYYFRFFFGENELRRIWNVINMFLWVLLQCFTWETVKLCSTHSLIGSPPFSHTIPFPQNRKKFEMLGAKIPKHKKPTTLDNDYVALVHCLHDYLLSLPHCNLGQSWNVNKWCMWNKTWTQKMNEVCEPTDFRTLVSISVGLVLASLNTLPRSYTTIGA